MSASVRYVATLRAECPDHGEHVLTLTATEESSWIAGELLADHPTFRRWVLRKHKVTVVGPDEFPLDDVLPDL